MNTLWLRFIGGARDGHMLPGTEEFDGREVEVHMTSREHPALNLKATDYKLCRTYPPHEDGTYAWIHKSLSREDMEAEMAHVRVQTDEEVTFSEWLDRRETTVPEIALEACLGYEVLLRLHPLHDHDPDVMVHGILKQGPVNELGEQTYITDKDPMRFTASQAYKIVKPKVAVSHVGDRGTHTVSAEVFADKPVPQVLPRPVTIGAQTGRMKVSEPNLSQVTSVPTSTPREIVMTQIQFVQADMKKGKKFEQVATMLDMLVEARTTEQPVVPFATLCEKAGAKYPQDVQAAVFALELSGVCDRYTYVEPGSTRSHDAYAIRDDAKLMGPRDEA